MNNEVIALLITVILGCVGIVNAIVVTKSKVDYEVMWAKFKLALDNNLKDMDAVIVQKSTLRSWVKNKKVEIAREIFEEIDKRLEALLKFYPCNGEFEDAKRFVDFHWKHIRHSIMCDYDAELKKKYLGEDINAPTKESEGDNGN